MKKKQITFIISIFCTNINNISACSKLDSLEGICDYADNMFTVEIDDYVPSYEPDEDSMKSLSPAVLSSSDDDVMYPKLPDRDIFSGSLSILEIIKLEKKKKV